MFSTRRKFHQQCTTADTTGTLPTQAFGIAGGREDMEMDRAWYGCLDAPSLMPAGSVRPVNISPEIGGMGYEGNVATCIERA